MKHTIVFTLALFATLVGAQDSPDEAAIRQILQDEITAWNQGNAVAYSRHFSLDGACTNIAGQFFTGHAAFLKQHEVIFQGLFKGTKLDAEVVSLRILGPDVAVVEVLTSVSGMAHGHPIAALDSSGRLRTRLLQVLARQSRQWKIVAYHNVSVDPRIPPSNR